MTLSGASGSCGGATPAEKKIGSTVDMTCDYVDATKPPEPGCGQSNPQAVNCSARVGYNFCGHCAADVGAECKFCKSGYRCVGTPCRSSCEQVGPTTGKCPSGYPVDCKNGYCCDSDFPVCCSNGTTCGVSSAACNGTQDEWTGTSSGGGGGSSSGGTGGTVCQTTQACSSGLKLSYCINTASKTCYYTVGTQRVSCSGCTTGSGIEACAQRAASLYAQQCR